ncbi:GNAT family N-acetyltransferase [Desnuesiella massiliensis]|uniref:GNAT family N-acetyltransferase n=1 Tax=Desnuesiella massiliensis TaxID=1650662 RepID=UPI0006E2A168|nr:GNAT family protein [Desnuesiella massiliensis]
MSFKLTAKSNLDLTGEKVYLKVLDKKYADEYLKLTCDMDSDSRLFTGTHTFFNVTQIENYLEDISTDNSRIDFLIFDKESTDIVGEVVLNDINRKDRRCNLRIGIFNKNNFSKGYGTEAIILALNYGFGMFNLHKIYLDVLNFNDRGVHVYEKIGFIKEGVLREDIYFNHRYYDVIMMSILENEFKERYLSLDNK